MRARRIQRVVTPGPEVIKHFSYSTQLSMGFILLINVKMPTIVGFLTFISRINNWLGCFKPEILIDLTISVFMSSLNFILSLGEHEKGFITLEPGDPHH